MYEKLNVRTDESGNNLNKFINRVLLYNPSSTFAGNIAISQETQDKIAQQPAEFSLGLNWLKYKEPEQFKRVTDLIAKGNPLSESMVANITAQGIEAKQASIDDAFVNGRIDKDQYDIEMKRLQDVRYKNL